MRLSFTVALTLALALACGGEEYDVDVFPELEPYEERNPAMAAPAPAPPAGSPAELPSLSTVEGGPPCCCASVSPAGAGFPVLPATKSCGPGYYDEACVPEAMCHLDAALPATAKDGRGEEVGIMRTMTLTLEGRGPVDIVVPDGAAMTHPKSNLIVYRGALSVIHEAVVSQITQVGYAADGVPVLAADSPTEIFGDSHQFYASGESRLVISVDEDCQGVTGLSCVLVH